MVVRTHSGTGRAPSVVPARFRLEIFCLTGEPGQGGSILSRGQETSPPSVLIVGGGLAGLAAAVGLAGQGVPSQVLESRPRLGGRANSFLDVSTNEWIDNCQHVSMGCCTNFRSFCEQVGIAHLFRREETLYFVAPDGRVNRFESTRAPAPLHLARAFARLSYLSWSEKFALARGLRTLARTRQPSATQTFADWLTQQHQPPRVIERFWHVVLVSALSESLDRVGVADARKVFVDGFLAHPDAWKVDIPQVPLGRLYGHELTDWLSARGATVRMNVAVDKLEIADDRVSAVVLRNGERLECEECVVAVPHYRLASLLPPDWAQHPTFAAVEHLETAPISSVHLWFDRPIMPWPHAVCVEGLVQWVFDRRDSLASSAEEIGHYYQVVISASRDLHGQSSDDVCAQVVEALRSVLPDARSATPRKSRLVSERRAVFSPVPGVDAYRPLQQSPIANLQLAGDYTQTGWPATMEGAVRSGFLAAENLLHRRGQPATLVAPDLPVSRLSRWLFGL